MHDANHEASGLLPPAKVAVWVDRPQIASWQAAVLRRLRETAAADLELLVVAHPDERPANGVIPHQAHALWAHNHRPSSGWLELIHERMVEGEPLLPDPFEPVDVRSLLPDVATLELRSQRTPAPEGGYRIGVSDTDNQQLLRHSCDVLIWFGTDPADAQLTAWPRHGVWSLLSGPDRPLVNDAVGYWESMENAPATVVMLSATSVDFPRGLVLSLASSSTNVWSVRDNRAAILWRAAEQVARQLELLQRLSPPIFFARAQRQREPQVNRRVLPASSPTAGQYAQHLATKFSAKIGHKLSEMTTFNQWGLFFHLSDQLTTDFSRYRQLSPPRDRIWADPQVLERDGKYYVFVEELLYGSNRGHIAMLTIDQHGRSSAATPVLTSDCHLSYPFVFEADGEVYMVPETSDRRTVELYRCVRFPDQWELEMRLMEDVLAVDTTLCHRDGRWWLFANMVQSPGTCSWDELFLFWADDFRTQDWHPHPLNPIITDVSCARPAGRLFELNGELYRPSQNCSGWYGRGFNLARVDALTRSDYREQIVQRVLPDWRSDLRGTHTFTRTGRLTVVDAQLSRWGRPTRAHQRLSSG